MRLLILASGPGVHAHEGLVAVHAPGDLFHCHNINCDQYLYQLVTVEKIPTWHICELIQTFSFTQASLSFKFNLMGVAVNNHVSNFQCRDLVT